MNIWTGFNIFILMLLAIDLSFFHSESKEITMKQSLSWSVLWLLMALFFGVGVSYYMGSKSELEYFTNYIIEK